MAFLDADPIAEGHVLLIPKEHYLDADDIPEDVFLHMMGVSRRMVTALKRTYKPDGCSVMQNGGQFNDIGHYHMHLFPRSHGDGFGWTASDKRIEISAEIAQQIKRNMG